MGCKFCGQFGGPVANKAGAKLKQATVTDLHEVFAELDKSGSGYMDVNGLNTASIKLGFPFRSSAELKEKFAEIDTNGKGRITELEFVEWWNKATPAAKRLQKQLEFLQVQEDYIKDEQKNLKREYLHAQEEVKRIQSVPLVIGQFNEAIDEHLSFRQLEWPDANLQMVVNFGDDLVHLAANHPPRAWDQGAVKYESAGQQQHRNA